jgi:hypothetical protein
VKFSRSLISSFDLSSYFSSVVLIQFILGNIENGVEMQKYILTTLILGGILVGETVKPRVIKAHDRVYRREGSYHHGRGKSMGVSSIEASFEISIELTSIGITEASSNATTNGQRRGVRRRGYAELKFLKDNRTKITQDISQGGGEHLLTLLTMMKLKRDRETLSKIQSNFDSLSSLDNGKLLSKLREISS